MCGILAYYGTNAKSRLLESISKIKHRGPDETKFFHQELLSIGFHRLAINEKSFLGSQPCKYKHYIGVVNGEIYNHMELREKFNLQIKGDCDSYVILPLFEKLGLNVISELDGFYSCLIFDTKKNLLFCIRDYIGKKPLFFGMSNNEIFITSELKAISKIDSFEILPKGGCSINLETKSIDLITKHQPVQLTKNISLETLVTNAVIKRLPKDSFGIFLSGGLDSSIITSIVAKYRKDVIYYALADKNSLDYIYIKELERYLGITVKYIKVFDQYNLQELIHKVVYSTESYNPSIISNGICTYLLAKAAHDDQLKVVLSGEGADEIFCGYHRFQKDDNWQNVRQRLIEDLHFTELRRVDQCCMAHSIENRCPFLDRVIYSFTYNLEYEYFFYNTNETIQNKYILRKIFKSQLPKKIIHRKKTSFDVGSGIRSLVVHYLTKENKTEKQQLKEIWQQYFSIDIPSSYFYSYPVFDKAIAIRSGTHK